MGLERAGASCQLGPCYGFFFRSILLDSIMLPCRNRHGCAELRASSSARFGTPVAAGHESFQRIFHRIFPDRPRDHGLPLLTTACHPVSREAPPLRCCHRQALRGGRDDWREDEGDTHLPSRAGTKGDPLGPVCGGCACGSCIYHGQLQQLEQIAQSYGKQVGGSHGTTSFRTVMWK